MDPIEQVSFVPAPVPRRDTPVSTWQQEGFATDTEGESERGGLLEYWRILRRRQGTVIVITCIGAFIGFLATIPQTPVYQARTTIEIVGMNDAFLNMNRVNPVGETGGGSEMLDIQTQIRILQSASLLSRVAEKLKPTGIVKASPDRFAALRKAINLPAEAPQDARSAALVYAANNLTVRAIGQTRIVEISIESTDSRMAADFANTLTGEFIEQNLEARWQTTETTSKWLVRQLDDMRIKLEHSEEELQQYASRAGLIFTQEKTNVDEDRLRQIQGTLTSAQAERISKQSRYEMAANSPPEALPDILNDSALRAYQSSITESRRKMAELSVTFTPEHASIKKERANLGELESAYGRERAAILTRIKNEYDEAVRKEKLIGVDYLTQTRTVTGQGEKAIQYNILKREVDSNRTVYDAMLQQLNTSTIASALRASNVRVVDPATVPRQPTKPQPTRSAGIGMLAGLFLGVGFVVMRERADRTLQQPGDAAFYLNLPELGIVPSSILDNKKRPTPASGEQPALDERVEMITFQRRPSMIAEAFRSVLVSIMFAGENGSRPRTILLTSANPAEGKSTAVSNLGIAIAEVGNRVLLIDADMRKPRLHTIFGVEEKPGLCEFLKERRGARLPAELIRPTEVPNLFVLPAGESTSAAVSLLYGNHMRDLLTLLKQQFDVVLIDTPPMLQISDARVLGRMADAIILILRADRTTRDAAQAAVQRFREDGSNVVGTILNDWNPKHAPGGYYGYNGYYDGYKRYYGAPPGDS